MSTPTTFAPVKLPTANRRPQNGAAGLRAAASRPGVDVCDVVCDAMPALIVGDLTLPDAELVRTHTESCGYCRNVLRRYQKIDDVLDRLNAFATDDVPPPPFIPMVSHRRASYAQIDSPVGPLYLAVSDQGVCEVGFGREETAADFEHRMERRGFDVTHGWDVVQPVARQLNEYFRGERNHFEVPLDFSGVSAFTRAVLSATAEVPYGRLSTYADIAKRVGRPKATRAVGNALGKNPIPVIIPCHRIVRSDASIGGYTGGLAIKERLLSLEGVMLPAM